MMPQTPWRLNPSQFLARGPAPATRTISLGQPWGAGRTDAARGSALHLALRCCLTRPDLAGDIAAATGLASDELALVVESAISLKDWLLQQGFPDLSCEIPVVAATAQGGQVSGTIDLLATGPEGCLLIDHKSGGPGEGFGPYWPQLSAYASMVPAIMPERSLRGVGIFWIDHGSLELSEGEVL